LCFLCERLPWCFSCVRDSTKAISALGFSLCFFLCHLNHRNLLIIENGEDCQGVKGFSGLRRGSGGEGDGLSKVYCELQGKRWGEDT
ncbi:hypothetical protein Tco_0754951, partial [Tanacetum coccineum]